ncbi:MAG: 4-hydroxy-tetrahydrodipicolinate reductase [Ruminococcus sp.]|jgi:4-hydroxy-tetrahydrodipicolinate reductase|nr:4-hydroxy-tetrahydrodipicolinate reductase [Ruminococcus sp.]
MLKLVISGYYGRMGQYVYTTAAENEDISVVAGIDRKDRNDTEFPIVTDPNRLTDLSIRPDVIIDFSNPSLTAGLLNYCQINDVGLVIATTGYSDKQVSDIKKAAANIPIFFTFNMSLGINLLCNLAKKASSVLTGFDIEIVEKHHNKKLDSPSGTAIMLADTINADKSKEYIYERQSTRRERNPAEIGIHSVRGGTIVGEHEVIFAGKDEVVSLTHTAYSRAVFATGAVNAAMFLQSKPAGLYDMSDLI